MTFGEYLGAGSAVTKGLYKLNGNSNDTSGNANNGSDTSVNYVNGYFGQCGDFNGTNSRVTLPNNLGFDNTGDWTLSLRTKGGTAPGNNQYRFMFSLFESTTSTTFRLGYANESGVLKVVYGKGRTNVLGENVANHTLSTTQFTHLLCTSAGGDTQLLYLNGVLFATGASRSGNGTLGTSNIGYIGSSEISGQFYNGLVDEAILENRIWTAVEVQKYYTYAKGRFGIL